MAKDYQPFEPKPKEEKVAHKRRLEKWNARQDKLNEEGDISHRRFNNTLTSNQVYESFKRGVDKMEYSKEDLLTAYRVVVQELFRNPDLEDAEIINMHNTIRHRVGEVYERRNRNARNIRV